MKLAICCILSFLLSFSFAQTWQSAYDSCLKYQQKQQYKKAIEWCDKALELYEKQVAEKDTNYSNILSTLSESCLSAGLYKQGELYAKKDSAWTKEKDIARYASSCNNLGLLYKSQNKYTESEVLLKEAKELSAKLLGKEHPDYATFCDNLGTLYELKGKYAEAELLYKEAKEIRARVLGKEHSSYATSCNNLAGLYRNQGKYIEAELLNKEAKEIRAKVLGREHPNYIASCNNLALLYQEQGKYAQAEPLFKEAKELGAKVLGRKHPNYATFCNNLALLYRNEGKYIDSELLFKEAKEIYFSVLGREHPDYVACCNNLASLYQEQGKYAEAELLFKEAKDIRANVLGKGHPEYAISCNNLASLYKMQGRYAEAESLYEESKNLIAKILGKEHRNYAISCSNLCSVYQAQGKYAEAELLCEEAKNIFVKILGKQHPYYAIACNNLALLYKYQGKYAEAESLYKEAKETCAKMLGREHPDYAISCNNIASLYQAQGKYSEAEELYKESKDLRLKILGKEHPDYAVSCNNLAKLYQDQNQYELAEPLFQEAIQIKLKEIQSNFKNLSESEKEKYIQANINLYFNSFQNFVLTRYTQNPAITQESYNLILQTKGLILQSTEKIKNRILNSKDEELKKLYVEWKLTKDKYAKAQNLTINERKQKKINLDSLAQQANELEKQLALKSEDFAHTFTPKTVTWKDIQNVLKKDQAAIEIVQINTKKDNKPNAKDSIVYMALIIKKNGSNPEVVILNNGNELEKQYITNYRRSITAKVQDTESYTVFWKPIAERLKGIKTVYFSADGVYHQINVSTLYNPQSKKYVFDEIQVINVTNTKDILSRRSYTSKNNYLIGNPKFDLQIESEPNNQKPKQERVFEGFLEGLSQLEGAEREVKRIAGLLPNSTVVTGVAATEEFVKSLKNPRILHIATHGYFKKGQYQSSTQAMLNAGLLFAGVVDYDRMEMRPLDKEDGKLTAFEVMNMELDSTELVVLSACETGLGQASKEGVYGLQRAFKVAGAQSIIMSLWKVNDEATQLLMTKFYENWQKKGMPKRKAFEVAQKQIRKHYKQPYYWGAFVMVE
ncbi:MAG: tetratricopeptide repeat protein [Bacteroidia bacterium]|nr:tetratricopeptide repeat protein [Bacteroidia bacterium]